MMARIQTTLICLLLPCLLQDSLSRHVPHEGGHALQPRIQRDIKNVDPPVVLQGPITHVTDVDAILQKHNITLPNGYLGQCTVVNSCEGLKEQLEDTNRQLQEKTSHTIQLEQEVFRLKFTVRQLRVKSTTCGLETSDHIAKLQAQLEDKMSQLEQMSHDNGNLVLRITALTYEVNELQKKNTSTSTSTKITDLLSQLEENNKQLQFKTEQLERNSRSAQRILEIIELQTQIWELEKTNHSQETLTQIPVLQRQLEAKINELEGNSEGSDDSKKVVMMITLENEVTELQKRISELTEESKTKITDQQRQLKEMNQQLIDKILQLPDNNTNTELTEEILALQNAINNINIQISSLQKKTNAQHAELQKTLNDKEKQQEAWKKQLKGEDETSVQLIMKIISIMREQRDLQIQTTQQMQTTAAQITALLQQVQDKEDEIDRVQAENKDLQKQLKENNATCFSLENKYDRVRGELEDKINLLNSQNSGISKLVLSIVALNDEVKWLRTQIISPEAADKIDELQKKLEQKNRELKTKSNELQEKSTNGQRILRIIEVQNLIWEFQKGVATQSNIYQIAVLQKELNDLTAEMEDKADDDSKLVLTITTLQSEVVNLQRMLSALSQSTAAQIVRPKMSNLENQISEIEKRIAELKEENPEAKITELTTQLKESERQLEENIKRLKKKDSKNSYLIMQILHLQRKLRDIQNAASQQFNETAADVTALQEQLEAREEESARCQAKNKDLEKRLGDKDAQCSGLQDRYDSLQDKLGSAMNKLDNVTGYNDKLVLEVWTLTNEVDDLKKRTVTSAAKINGEYPCCRALFIANHVCFERSTYVSIDPVMIFPHLSELQKLLDAKIKELAKKTQELEDNAPQPENILRIIAIQNEILNLQKGVSNGTNFDQIAALENELDALIATIEEKNNGNCKQILQIIALQNQVTRLQRQELEFNQSSEAKIAELENQLQETRDQLNEKNGELKETDSRIPQLIAEIMGLRNKLTELERTLSELKRTSADKMEDLQSLLKQKSKQLEEITTQLRAVDAKNAEQILKIIELQKEMKAIQTEASKAKDKSVSEISELQKQLKAKEKLNARLDSKNRELEKFQKEMKMECDEIQHRCKEVQLQNDQNQEDLLKMQQQLREEEAAFNRLQQQLRDSKDDNARLQRRNKSLQDENDKLKMNLQDLLVDPETIVHSTKVALDPDTAHPKIILSTDETEMSVAQQRQNVPNNPGRYDLSLAALGKTGFNRGRNYWEVEVAGKTCYNIGVARGSANRKGQLKLKPAEGYWTIILTKQGVLKALAAGPLDIQLPELPQKFGILLDYKKGEVSFYNANTRSLLHTFTGNRFTDKLYPFFNTCLETNDEDAPIVLTPVGSVSWIQ
ncbi:putative leucine-rich repeat-containing protein DDB_G0290503 isoform X1 [Salvelinus fontinalis]|uniref:putative leucine-rich repeat-containing protein DDB_G0290503 isoform X1 n=1 Tax=Salvelinus fontinalis TaxID=8038 RepID=UPI00248514B7|nr:putative leucine-rich repeat-containing protein DDB_G0290503 isoform X1 [Salvelinus fontinalis]